MVLIRTITIIIITLGAAVIRSGRQSVTADKQKQRYSVAKIRPRL